MNADLITTDLQRFADVKRIRVSFSLSQRKFIGIVSRDFGIDISQARLSLIERGKAECPPELVEVLPLVGSTERRTLHICADTLRLLDAARRPGESRDAALRRVLGGV